MWQASGVYSTFWTLSPLFSYISTPGETPWSAESQFIGDVVSQSDPIADMLTRVRTALALRGDWVVVPSSKIKKAIAQVLKDERFVSEYQVVKDGVREVMRIRLKYNDSNQPAITGLKRVSKPGLRVYVTKKELPRFHGGRGGSIISTPQGMMTGQEAWRKGLGGELICYVW